MLVYSIYHFSCRCIPCPPGQIVDSKTNKCHQCPPNTVANGQTSCEPCGLGLHTKDNVKCVTECKIKTEDGNDYDFTSLAGYVICLFDIMFQEIL